MRVNNHDHRHSGIRYVTPAQRHAGQDQDILRARHNLYTQARKHNPSRWSGNTRTCSPITLVTLNPERTEVLHTAQSRRTSSSTGSAGNAPWLLAHAPNRRCLSGV